MTPTESFAFIVGGEDESSRWNKSTDGTVVQIDEHLSECLQAEVAASRERVETT